MLKIFHGGGGGGISSAMSEMCEMEVWLETAYLSDALQNGVSSKNNVSAQVIQLDNRALLSNHLNHGQITLSIYP